MVYDKRLAKAPVQKYEDIEVIQDKKKWDGLDEH